MAEIHSVLITGASRGIGLEFVKQFLSNPLVRSNAVIAACRSPEKATELIKLKEGHPKLHVVKLDVTKFDEYDRVVHEVSKIVRDKGLTMLINNAALGADPKHNTLNNVTADLFISKFATNSVAPVMLAKAFLPLLQISAKVNAAKNNDSLSVTRAALINITSRGGSITRNTGGLYWAYRESKAALNMSTQTLALELQKEGILVEAIHPGGVITDLTAPHNFPDLIDTATSVTAMLKVFLSLKEKNTQGIISYTGDVIPY